MPLISTKNLALAYDGQRVIDGLSFTVEVGGYLCIGRRKWVGQEHAFARGCLA